MSTQIVDNFQLNVGKPIDSRMVTSGTASRNALKFKYEGLRVYDLINKAPYVYIDSAWQQESSSGGGGGGGSTVPSGTTNYLLKYTTSTTIGDSAIVDKGSFALPNIGIGKNPGNGIALDVKGSVKVSSLESTGTLKGELNGNYISVKSLGIDKIIPGTNNQILKTVGSGNLATIQWGSDTNSTIKIDNETSTTTGTYLLLFSNSTGDNSSVYSNNNVTRLIGVKPSTSQILASGDATTNTASAPGYAFSGTTNAGLYGNTTEIGLSFNAKALLKLDNTKLSILDNTGTTTLLSSDTGGINFGPGAFIKSTAGTLALPDYTWQGDTSTGIYRPGASQIGFTTNGTARLTITNTLTTISTPATLSSTLAVTGTSTFTGLSTFGSVTVGGTFKLTSGTPGVNKVLTSDASGSGTWQSPPQDSPYGTIIMWLSTTIPSGWRECKEYTQGSGINIIHYHIWVYTQGSYVEVPNFNDKVIMGGSSVSYGGDTSPKVAHTSGAKITRNQAGDYTYTKITTLTGNSALNYQYKGVVQVRVKEAATNALANWAGTVEPTDDGGMLFTNTGITKYQQLIFIVKINESASANQEGHWKYVDVESITNTPSGPFGL